MTDTPTYEASARSRRRLAIAVGVLAAALAMSGGAYALWTLDASAGAAELGANETLDVAVADAPADFGAADGERLFTITHRGGADVHYRNVRVVVYDEGTAILTLDADEWRTGSVALRESGTRPSNASAFTPGDRLVLTEQHGENASIFEDGDTYVVALVDAESGRTLGRDTLILD